jgi:phosphatidylserine synthase
MLDGAVSRRFGMVSDFGARVDVLQDSFNYVIFPALFFHRAGLNGVLGMIVLNAFVICGIMRLARFSIIGFTPSGDIPGYSGMPVYFSHVLILSYLAFPWHSDVLPLFSLALILQSFLMISDIAFPKPRRIVPWFFMIVTLGIIFSFS